MHTFFHLYIRAHANTFFVPLFSILFSIGGFIQFLIVEPIGILNIIVLGIVVLLFTWHVCKDTNVISLEKRYLSLERSRPHEAAEYAYALTLLHYRKGNKRLGREFCHLCIDLLNRCPSEKHEDWHHSQLGGVRMPRQLHDSETLADFKFWLDED